MSDDTGHSANPYVDEIKTALRLQDREGYPFGAPHSKPAPQPAMVVQEVRGHIKFIDPVKGFGFIARDDGAADVFIHRETLRTSGFTSFIPGAGCGIEVEAVDRGEGRGLVATRVRWLEWHP